MSTHTNADFNAALTGYHAALAAYHNAVNAIEDDARQAQTHGRVALAHVNEQTLNAGSRATCVVRATVDAQILALDLATNAQPKVESAIEGTIDVLQARMRLLQSCIDNLNAARKALDEQLAKILQNGRVALEALRKHLPDEPSTTETPK